MHDLFPPLHISTMQRICQLDTISPGKGNAQTCIMPMTARQQMCERCGTMLQVIEAQDVLYGRPGPGLQQRIKAAIETIMGMQTWDDFFRLVGVKLNLPTAQMVTKLLRRGWLASLRKGYHKKVRACPALCRPCNAGWFETPYSEVICLHGRSDSTAPDCQISSIESGANS